MVKQPKQIIESLRSALATIESGLNDLKTKIGAKAKSSEQEVRGQLEHLQQRKEQDRSKVLEAKAKVKDWAEARNIETRTKINEWKARNELTNLQNRADRAEIYAAACMDIAAAAVHDAEEAALEAWIAWLDANSATAEKGSVRTSL
ncbi:MAG: hypothetical protein WBX25_37445 [Rhodomicrobium sp.]